MRRGSFGGNRKPACLFYPSGRCRNGDECRFPHVIPDAPAQPQLGTRGSRARDGANDISTIEENFTTVNVRDVSNHFILHLALPTSVNSIHLILLRMFNHDVVQMERPIPVARSPQTRAVVRGA